jgi:glycosyltransferase involved in cell wall biosynthesis
MKTIIHVENAYNVTGAYKALFSFCKRYNSARHVWVLPKGSSIIDQTRKHFTVYELPFVEIGKSPRKLINYLPSLYFNGKKLAGIVEKEKADLLHANDLYNLTPYAAARFLKRKVPIVVHARLLKNAFPGVIYRFWTKFHLKNADAVIAVSEAIKKDWNNDARIRIIYDRISIKETLPGYDFESLPAKPFRFLYLANYIPGKGQEDALHAIKNLTNMTREDFAVDFYGGTMGLKANEIFKDALLKKAQELGIEKQVNFYGQIDKLEQVLKQYHCSLHFSHAESFGMVCFESMYFGLPVISTRCGGPEEMIDDDISGILVDVKDRVSQAAAMKKLLENRELAIRLSHNAPLAVKEKFKDADTMLDRFFDYLLQANVNLDVWPDIKA